MELSVDISLYPLQEGYIPIIIDFIHRIQQYDGVEVERNKMTTQLFGEYDVVMAALQKELKRSYEEYGKAVLVAKFINGDARNRP
jgi:uncharacterized protein YqgV (UPF0045/DUF77 family)